MVISLLSQRLRVNKQDINRQAKLDRKKLRRPQTYTELLAIKDFFFCELEKLFPREEHSIWLYNSGQTKKHIQITLYSLKKIYLDI